MTTPQKRDLNELVFLLKVAKLNEEQAKKERLVLETLILGELPVKSEGTVSQKTENGTVSVSYGMTRKVDDISLVAAWAGRSLSGSLKLKWLNLKRFKNYCRLSTRTLQSTSRQPHQNQQ